MASKVDKSISGDYAPVSVSDELHLKLLPCAWHKNAGNEQLNENVLGFSERIFHHNKIILKKRTSQE